MLTLRARSELSFLSWSPLTTVSRRYPVPYFPFPSTSGQRQKAESEVYVQVEKHGLSCPEPARTGLGRRIWLKGADGSEPSAQPEKYLAGLISQVTGHLPLYVRQWNNETVRC